MAQGNFISPARERATHAGGPSPSRREFLCASATLACLPPAGRSAEHQPVIAETAFGKVRGVDQAGIKTFKGIPYGANTAGARRFQPPADPAHWTGVRDALAWGPTAPQSDPGAAAAAAEGEDCLVLNIWTPALRDGHKRPVLFWCHGGGFATGSGSGPGTDGANLARRGDVVVVTINHRLNALGFAHLEEFGGPEFGESGGVGMLDIVHALRWVKANIAQFGGDSAKVTIFGQSGGGRKVATLLAMPAAKGLFHRAIIQSGATVKLVDPQQGTRVAAELLSQLGLPRTGVRELQQVPLDKLMRGYHAAVRALNVDPMTMGFSPVVNGRSIPTHPFHPVASPVSPDVPLLIGSTRTELTTQSEPDAFTLDAAGLRDRVEQLVGAGLTGETLEVYRRLNPQASAPDLYFLIASDHRYGAPAMKIAERRAALEAGPVFLYYFRWETPAEGGRLHSPHGIEVPFAFDNVKTHRLTKPSPTAPALAERVSNAWIAFARTGNPNTPKLPAWPRYEPRLRPTMVFNDECTVANDPIGEQRAVMFKAWKYS